MKPVRPDVCCDPSPMQRRDDRAPSSGKSRTVPEALPFPARSRQTRADGISNASGRSMMDIRRIDVTQGPGPRMSRCVVRGDTVYLCGLTAADSSQDVKGQTRQILERIDSYLQQAGTSKSNLLTANLWIKDMALFADMNSVWNEWVDPQNPPARACVRADLARPEILVEIMVTAAK
jgi:enamine deaminase RidA (YjgF/YER057c/UK114 family)